MNRTMVLHLGLVALIVVSVTALAVIRAVRPAPIVQPAKVVAHKATKTPVVPAEDRSEEPEIPRPKAESNPDKLPAALHDSTIKGLIQRAKVAQLRGDTKTRDAMVNGLKRQADRSKELIQKELVSARDDASVTALQKLMEALQ